MKTKFASLLIVCALLLSSFASKESLLVGTNAEFPPFTSIEDGKIVGFDIDVATEVAKRLGKQITFKDVPFEALIPDLVLGYVDFVAAGLSYTEERAQKVLFTKPYVEGDPLIILTAEKSDQPLTLNDLVGKSVAVNEGFTADSLLSSIEGIHLVRLATTSDAFMALKSKRVTAFVTAKSTYETFMKAQKESFYSHEIEGTSETCVLAVPKTKPELLKAIQGALDAMQQDGTMTALKTKWGFIPI
jgi:ABC-type amino acid transport substrate-binding protein